MKDIIEKVNEILVSENAKPLEDENDLLIDSELDSFGYVILWIELNEEYKCFPVEYVNEIDYDSYKLKDLIQRIQNEN
jgi:acyl carrier protein